MEKAVQSYVISSCHAVHGRRDLYGDLGAVGDVLVSCRERGKDRRWERKRGGKLLLFKVFLQTRKRMEEWHRKQEVVTIVLPGRLLSKRSCRRERVRERESGNQFSQSPTSESLGCLTILFHFIHFWFTIWFNDYNNLVERKGLNRDSK